MESSKILIGYIKREKDNNDFLAKMLCKRNNYELVEFCSEDFYDDERRVNFIDAPSVSILVLPLAMRGYLALRFAEEVHLLNSGLKLYLKSSTDAPSEIMLQLFDAFSPFFELSEIERLLNITNPCRIQSKIDIGNILHNIFLNASCFNEKDDWRDHHDPGRACTVEEYEAAKTVGYKNLIRMNDLIVNQTDQAIIVNNISNYNIQQAGAVGPHASSTNDNFILGDRNRTV